METVEPLVNDRGVITVKEAGPWLVEIVPMIFNYRLVLTPKTSPDGWDAGWCYFGRGPDVFVRCLRALCEGGAGLRPRDPG